MGPPSWRRRSRPAALADRGEHDERVCLEPRALDHAASERHAPATVSVSVSLALPVPLPQPDGRLGRIERLGRIGVSGRVDRPLGRLGFPPGTYGRPPGQEEAGSRQGDDSHDLDAEQLGGGAMSRGLERDQRIDHAAYQVTAA